MINIKLFFILEIVEINTNNNNNKIKLQYNLLKISIEEINNFHLQFYKKQNAI